MIKSNAVVKTVLVFIVATSLVQPSLGEARKLREVAANEVGFSAERLQRLDKSLDTYVTDNRLPGGVMLVARQGKVAYFRAFGWRDKEAETAMTKDAIFRIASQTKAITSVAIMMLQERGELLIGDPVGKYLPEFAQTTVAAADDKGGYKTVPANRAITLRDLLSHTAGIGYGYGPAKDKWQKAGLATWYFSNRDEPVRETIARIAALPQDKQPGEAFVYGYNTDILGAVVEVVSGKPLDQFFRDEIFEPLGMNDTHFYLPPAKAERLAVVYAATENGIERAANPHGNSDPTFIGQGHHLQGPRKSFSGGAGLVSTAADYAQFLQMLLNGGELQNERLLSRKTVELMTANHLSDKQWVGPGLKFGLGFWVLGDLGQFARPGTLKSYGWGGAYHSVYWVDPEEDMLVVYMTQLLPSGEIDDHDKIRALVYQAVE
ncbi:beta-lactamase family protein [Exilibacterium tricleocarpae]|uniref:Beta-lactamase family protein n=1 Tax=Exilibacterium tricleocarpae TaxID=2591008 RepID=A0A545SY83_9GAMM|nr:serine hydrolase domain-containing protein [Exilibacterium tricleocarpae]TQV69920.1 beta-lactamase family protein [Exilibacterium tricleocarpae]